MERLAAASRSADAWAQSMFGLVGELMSLGFPNYFAAGSKAPFDILGDTMRGTRGVVMDMFRYPDKVLAACERLVPVAINWALKRPGVLGTPVIFLPLHKGADGFMSDEQFKTFYWPTLRAVILGLIEEGCIPFMFAEGRYNQRLEAIMDLPRGKTVWLFDQTDMARAKETIGHGGVHPGERTPLLVVRRVHRRRLPITAATSSTRRARVEDSSWIPARSLTAAARPTCAL